MKSIFVITESIRGPGGCGETGMPYLALKGDDDGNPITDFASREKAEYYLKHYDSYNQFRITEISVLD